VSRYTPSAEEVQHLLASHPGFREAIDRMGVYSMAIEQIERLEQDNDARGLALDYLKAVEKRALTSAGLAEPYVTVLIRSGRRASARSAT
jgi:hypothetical protein